MRAPVEFVATRHRITHPDESPAQAARHTHTHYSSMAAALKRLDTKGLTEGEQLVAHLVRLPERPTRRQIAFQVPNPAHWLDEFTGPRWISGEDAAAAEGYNLVPDHHLVYIRPADREAAIGAALAVLGRLASPSAATLTIRMADPWLHLPAAEDLVERGQRLLDYFEDPRIQLARSLGRHA